MFNSPWGILGSENGWFNLEPHSSQKKGYGSVSVWQKKHLSSVENPHIMDCDIM